MTVGLGQATPQGKGHQLGYQGNMFAAYLGCCWFLALVPASPTPSLEPLPIGCLENAEPRPISGGSGLKIQVKAVMKTLGRLLC